MESDLEIFNVSHASTCHMTFKQPPPITNISLPKITPLQCTFPHEKFAAAFSNCDCGFNSNSKEQELALAKDKSIQAVVVETQTVTKASHTIGVAKQMVDMVTQTNLERRNLI